MQTTRTVDLTNCLIKRKTDFKMIIGQSPLIEHFYCNIYIYLK